MRSCCQPAQRLGATSPLPCPFVRHANASTLYTRILFHLMSPLQNLFYLPTFMLPCWAICAFCSWNLSPNLSELFKNLSTHRITQPSSLPSRLLDVKSVTQSLKHLWTRFEYIYGQRQKLRRVAGAWSSSYVHEILHLLPLHPPLQLALLGGVQPWVMLVSAILGSGCGSVARVTAAETYISMPLMVVVVVAVWTVRWS